MDVVVSIVLVAKATAQVFVVLLVVVDGGPCCTRVYQGSFVEDACGYECICLRRMNTVDFE